MNLFAGVSGKVLCTQDTGLTETNGFKVSESDIWRTSNQESDFNVVIDCFTVVWRSVTTQAKRSTRYVPILADFYIVMYEFTILPL